MSQLPSTPRNTEMVPLKTESKDDMDSFVCVARVNVDRFQKGRLLLSTYGSVISALVVASFVRTIVDAEEEEVDTADNQAWYLEPVALFTISFGLIFCVNYILFDSAKHSYVALTFDGRIATKRVDVYKNVLCVRVRQESWKASTISQPAVTVSVSYQSWLWGMSAIVNVTTADQSSYQIHTFCLDGLDELVEAVQKNNATSTVSSNPV